MNSIPSQTVSFVAWAEEFGAQNTPPISKMGLLTSVVIWLQYQVTAIIAGALTSAAKADRLFKAMQQGSAQPKDFIHANERVYKKLESSLESISISEKYLKSTSETLSTVYCLARSSKTRDLIASLGQHLLDTHAPEDTDEEGFDADTTATKRNGTPIVLPTAIRTPIYIEESDDDASPLVDDPGYTSESERSPSMLRRLRDSLRRMRHTESTDEKRDRYKRNIEEASLAIESLHPEIEKVREEGLKLWTVVEETTARYQKAWEELKKEEEPLKQKQADLNHAKWMQGRSLFPSAEVCAAKKALQIEQHSRKEAIAQAKRNEQERLAEKEEAERAYNASSFKMYLDELAAQEERLREAERKLRIVNGEEEAPDDSTPSRARQLLSSLGSFLGRFKSPSYDGPLN